MTDTLLPEDTVRSLFADAPSAVSSLYLNVLFEISDGRVQVAPDGLMYAQVAGNVDDHPELDALFDQGCIDDSGLISSDAPFLRDMTARFLGELGPEHHQRIAASAGTPSTGEVWTIELRRDGIYTVEFLGT